MSPDRDSQPSPILPCQTWTGECLWTEDTSNIQSLLDLLHPLGPANIVFCEASRMSCQEVLLRSGGQRVNFSFPLSVWSRGSGTVDMQHGTVPWCKGRQAPSGLIPCVITHYAWGSTRDHTFVTNPTTVRRSVDESADHETIDWRSIHAK